MTGSEKYLKCSAADAAAGVDMKIVLKVGAGWKTQVCRTCLDNDSLRARMGLLKGTWAG